MINPSNGLSLVRAPLALLFVIESVTLRIAIVILAMITDFVDGYLARKWRCTSRLGAILDPMMDKFFVFIVLGILFFENKIQLWQIMAMVSRDFFLALFGAYLLFTKSLKSYQFNSVMWSKVTTAAQFIVLLSLIIKWPVIPSYVYPIFIGFGSLAFIELLRSKRSMA